MTAFRRGALVVIAVTAVLAAVAAGRLTRQAVDVAPPSAVERAAVSNVPDEAGVVASALEHVRLLGSTEMYDSAARRRVLAVLVDPGVQDQLDRAFGLAAQNLGVNADGSAEHGTLVARLVPVGHRVESFTPERAVVAVWAVGLLGVAGQASRLPVQASWSTETMTFEWRDGGWRWIDLAHADGPAPIGSAQVPAPADVLARTADAYAEPRYGG